MRSCKSLSVSLGSHVHPEYVPLQHSIDCSSYMGLQVSFCWFGILFGVCGAACGACTARDFGSFYIRRLSASLHYMNKYHNGTQYMYAHTYAIYIYMYVSLSIMCIYICIYMYGSIYIYIYVCQLGYRFTNPRTGTCKASELLAPRRVFKRRTVLVLAREPNMAVSIN